MKKSVRVILWIGIGLLIIFVPVLLYGKLNKNYRQSHQDKLDDLKIREDITLEVNSLLLSVKDLFSREVTEPSEIKYYLNDEEVWLSSYDEVNTYEVVVNVKDKEYRTTLTIQDTIKPDLKLKNVMISEGEKYSINDFVEECTDNSGKVCLLEYKNPVEYDKEGVYDIDIIARDTSGNFEEETTKLTILKENTAGKEEKNMSQSNNSSKKNESNQNSLENSPKFVEKKKDVQTTSEDFKYGVKINKTMTTTYELYSDGSIKNQKTSTKTSYDYSGYQASAKDLLPEAIENRTTYQNEVTAVLDSTNKYRQEVGLENLSLDEDLTKVAMVRAMEMGYGNKLSHFRPNGDIAFSVADELGFGDFWGENLAWGQANGQEATKWWRNSPGHYLNMVGDYTKLGVGVLKFNGRYLWVQVFA